MFEALYPIFPIMLTGEVIFMSLYLDFSKEILEYAASTDLIISLGSLNLSICIPS